MAQQLRVGEIRGGYVYMGGDQNDARSWRSTAALQPIATPATVPAQPQQAPGAAYSVTGLTAPSYDPRKDARYDSLRSEEKLMVDQLYKYMPDTMQTGREYATSAKRPDPIQMIENFFNLKVPWAWRPAKVQSGLPRQDRIDLEKPPGTRITAHTHRNSCELSGADKATFAKYPAGQTMMVLGPDCVTATTQTETGRTGRSQKTILIAADDRRLGEALAHPPVFAFGAADGGCLCELYMA
jgi:hypothetical protein